MRNKMSADDDIFHGAFVCRDDPASRVNAGSCEIIESAERSAHYTLTCTLTFCCFHLSSECT